jgi:biotin carboxylase
VPSKAREPTDSEVERIVQALGLPVIAKPLEGVGCEGVQLLDDSAAIARFLRTPRARPFELDEFLAGPVFNADAVIHGGEVRWFGACELLHPPVAVLAGATFASWTLPAHHRDLIELRRVTDRVIEALDPPDGAVHLEAIRTSAGFRFLEIACRNAGWLIPDAYEAAEGIDLRVAHLHAAANLPPAVRRRHARAGGYFGAIRTRPGAIAHRVAPPVDIAHRLTHRDGRSEAVASQAIMLADLLCEVVVWDDDHARVQGALRSLDGFEPFVLET